MTLDDAIKQSSILLAVAQLLESADNEAAIKLGIEALKQIQRIRLIEGNPDICWLPGETEE